MNEQERQRLTDFLQKLVQTRTDQVDPLAQDMINEAVQNQPRSTYLLVQYAMFLERKIDNAQAPQNLNSDQTKASESQFFNTSSSTWGQNTTSAKSSILLSKPSNSEKKFNRFDLEERGINFLGNNSGKVWILIAVIAYIVVKNRSFFE